MRLATHVLLLGLLVVLLYAAAHAGGLGRSQDEGTAQAGVTAAPKSSAGQGAAPVAASMISGPSALSPGASAPQSRPAVLPVSLSEELASFTQGLDGTYGVAVRNLRDGQTVMINADHVFPSASLYKVLVMHRVYQFMEQKKLSATTPITFVAEDLLEAEAWDKLSAGDVLTVGDALDRMITSSSNPAAYALARITGGWNPVLATARELGMMSTTWDGGDFVTTPADMLRFFQLLGSRSLVSPKASDDMMALLLRQRINDRIPASLPQGTKVAHKTGELAQVRNDGGIVFTSKGSYAIVLMSEGIDPTKAAQAEARISRMVFDRLGS
jgi:beta-lactamase class A